jgi:hypothetical protein
VSGCNVSGCHSNNPLTEFNVGNYSFTYMGVAYTGIMDVVEAMLDSIEVLLIAEGIKDPAGLATTGDYTQEVAAAYWNYISVEEDRSDGVHSPAYVYQILRETLVGLTTP